MRSEIGIKGSKSLGRMVAHTFKPGTREAEAGVSLRPGWSMEWVPG